MRITSLLLTIRMRQCVVGLFAAAIFNGLAHTSLAIPLAVGATVFSAGEPDPLGGAVIAGGVPVPFVAATFTGTLTSSVILGDTTNPFGAGALTFTYLIKNDAGSPHAIGRLTVDDFSTFLTDVNFQTPAGGVAPAFFDRSGGAGDVIGFTFFGAPVGGGQIPAGGSSALLVVQTNSRVYSPTLASVIDGSVASVASYAPIPEPSSVVLCGFGLIGLLAICWRRTTRR